MFNLKTNDVNIKGYLIYAFQNMSQIAGEMWWHAGPGIEIGGAGKI